MSKRRTIIEMINESIEAFGLRWCVRDLRRMVLKVVADQQHPKHEAVCNKLIEINRLEMEIQQIVGFDYKKAAEITDPKAKNQIDITASTVA